MCIRDRLDAALVELLRAEGEADEARREWSNEMRSQVRATPLSIPGSYSCAAGSEGDAPPLPGAILSPLVIRQL
eukprot:4126490-Prymnesium_polylepis.2